MRRVLSERDRAIGAQIEKLRKANNVSQEAMGEALGVSHPQFGKLERGQSRVSLIDAMTICTVLACRLDDIAAPFYPTIAPMTERAFEIARRLDKIAAGDKNDIAFTTVEAMLAGFEKDRKRGRDGAE